MEQTHSANSINSLMISKQQVLQSAKFPTVGLIDGNFRANLEETGMGYGLEVEMIRLAHEKDLLTTPYVFSAEDAIAMTKAGADIIVPHKG